jgi:hypothetical protein
MKTEKMKALMGKMYEWHVKGAAKQQLPPLPSAPLHAETAEQAQERLEAQDTARIVYLWPQGGRCVLTHHALSLCLSASLSVCLSLSLSDSLSFFPLSLSLSLSLYPPALRMKHVSTLS